MLILMFFDEITGLMKAVYQRRLTSSIGTHGLLIKSGCIMGVLAFWIFESLVPGIPPIDVVLAGSFSLFELISNLENLKAMNVPLPRGLLAFMAIASDQFPPTKIVKSTKDIVVDDPAVPNVHETIVSLEQIVKSEPKA